MRIVLIDDHPLFRAGVARILTTEPDFSVIGEGATAAEAVALVAELAPDILLLDIDIPGNGIASLREIRAAGPTTRVILLTAAVSEQQLAEGFRAGAQGYVLKGVPARELASIIRSVHAGQGYAPPSLAAGLLTLHSFKAAAESQEPLNVRARLTEREQQILDLIANGSSNKQIALLLCLTEKTVKNHMTSIMQKLRVRNRVEAALLAAREAQAQTQA
jgi:two-component system, NarL family, nitrate/nitrite response regulator NarL